MSNVSGSTPSAPVTHVKLFIAYALGHVTTATVKDVFDLVFNNEVTQIEELERKDRDTGKSFKLFWVTLAPDRHSRVWRFVNEIEQVGFARITYETHKGKDYFWKVRINKDKEPAPVKFTPRIMPREETTSNNATAKERADVIAFTKTPAFSKLVNSVVFEGVIEPKLEPGEIKEKKVKFNVASKAAGITVEKDILEDEKRERAAIKDEMSSYGKRMEEQEAALAEWESKV